MHAYVLSQHRDCRDAQSGLNQRTRLTHSSNAVREFFYYACMAKRKEE